LDIVPHETETGDTSMRNHLLRVCFCLAVAGMLTAQGSVSAQGKKKGNAGSPYAQVLSELQQTRVLLNQADRDYSGFRAKAVHEVGKAMHALHPKHKHKLPPAPKVTGAETQAVSDMQLAKAQQQIQVIINQLASNTANPNTATAVAHLRNAVGHLNTALKIK
jgi:thioredoxin-like negative regulator of GroEL